MKGRFALIAGLGVVLSTQLFWRPALSAPSDCKPIINVEPISAGLSQISVSATCFPRGKVHFHYDTLELIRALDETGRLALAFDCFLGDKPTLIAVFPDGSAIPVQLQTVDLDRVTKVAVIWKGSVNLDLHAFEYAASSSDQGHIWAAAASSRWEAEERRRRDKQGHGFLSFSSDGSAEGDQLEVYTFVHEPSQQSGAVTLALDYESRARRPQDPDTCGTGLYADLEYHVAVWRPNGHISRSRGSFAPLECNQVYDQLARYSSKALPQLILTR
jgi:hypothetical protein